jgi:hypothetical protein
VFSLPSNTGLNLFSYVSQLIGDFKYPIAFFLGLIFLEFIAQWFMSLWKKTDTTDIDKQLNTALLKTDFGQAGQKIGKSQSKLIKKALELENNFKNVMKGEGISIYTE